MGFFLYSDRYIQNGERFDRGEKCFRPGGGGLSYIRPIVGRSPVSTVCSSAIASDGNFGFLACRPTRQYIRSGIVLNSRRLLLLSEHPPVLNINDMPPVRVPIVNCCLNAYNSERVVYKCLRGMTPSYLSEFCRPFSTLPGRRQLQCCLAPSTFFTSQEQRRPLVAEVPLSPVQSRGTVYLLR